MNSLLPTQYNCVIMYPLYNFLSFAEKNEAKENKETYLLISAFLRK